MAVSKTVVRVSVPGVRIPPLPPSVFSLLINKGMKGLHIVPLSRQAIEVLNEAKKRSHFYSKFFVSFLESLHK